MKMYFKKKVPDFRISKIKIRSHAFQGWVPATHKSSQVVPRCSVEKMFLVACRAVKLMYSFINISCQISIAS